MCDQCQELHTTWQRLEDDTQECSLPVEELDWELCGRRAAWLMRDPNTEHLCEEHMRARNAAWDEGLGDLQRAAGVAVGGDFLPVLGEATCEQVRIPLAVEDMTPCGEQATWVEVTWNEESLCEEHAIEMGGGSVGA